MGLNINKMKKTGEQTSKKSKKKETSKKQHTQRMDYFDSGIRVIESTSTLINTIVTARKDTRLAEIELESKQTDLERDLFEFQTTLEKDLKEIELEIVKYKADTEVKQKELDVHMYELSELEETKRMKIRNEHESKIRMLDMQQSILETVMGMYKKYYDAMFMGVVLPVTPANITNDMHNCIQSLNTSIQYLNQSKPQITMNTELDY